MRALHTAATGMLAQELNVEVISNNIANMRTTGYKRQRAEFQDLLYETMRRVGSTTSDQGTMVPAGIQIGSGVRTAATPRVMTQGDVSPTEKDLDVAIRGEGFFRIQLPDGRTAYTRDGSFERDAQGQLVTADGYLVDPGITIPDGAIGHHHQQAGDDLRHSRRPDGADRLRAASALAFRQQDRPRRDRRQSLPGDRGSGAPQDGTAASEGYGDLLQGYLEQANVNSVSEISDLIAAQRAYEMNSKVVSAADEMSQTTSGMFR